MESLTNLVSIYSKKSWEEDIKKVFETVINTERIFLNNNGEKRFPNDNEKFYFINFESLDKLLKDIEEKTANSNNLSDKDIVLILMKLKNIYEQNENKEIKIRSLFIQRNLIVLLEERTLTKIKNINKNSKNFSLENNGNITEI